MFHEFIKSNRVWILKKYNIAFIIHLGTSLPIIIFDYEIYQI